MTAVAIVKAPMLSVDRGPKGRGLCEAKGSINHMPLMVTVTEVEIHIGWIDRKGPAFAIALNQVVQAAVTEIETLLGQQKGGMQ